MLHPGRFQPRRHFDPEQIEALAESIRAQGVLQPLLVRPHPERRGEYEILAGERRWRAAQAARLSRSAGAGARDRRPRRARNRAGREYSAPGSQPSRKRAAISRLADEFGHTQEDIARATGKSRPHIANTLRLLNLPPEVIALVLDGKLTAGHVRPLIGHDDALALARRGRDDRA